MGVGVGVTNELSRSRADELNGHYTLWTSTTWASCTECVCLCGRYRGLHAAAQPARRPGRSSAYLATVAVPGALVPAPGGQLLQVAPGGAAATSGARGHIRIGATPPLWRARAVPPPWQRLPRTSLDAARREFGECPWCLLLRRRANLPPPWQMRTPPAYPKAELQAGLLRAKPLALRRRCGAAELTSHMPPLWRCV